MPNEIKTLNTDETASLLGVCKITVYNMIKDGRLDSFRKVNAPKRGRGSQHNITLKSVVGQLK
mgnify:FL=1